MTNAPVYNTLHAPKRNKEIENSNQECSGENERWWETIRKNVIHPVHPPPLFLSNHFFSAPDYHFEEGEKKSPTPVCNFCPSTPSCLIHPMQIENWKTKTKTKRELLSLGRVMLEFMWHKT